MKTLFCLILLSLIGCSSPTQYVPSKDNKGYSDRIINNNLRVAEFQGNAKTSKETAELYSKFRAIELCKEMNKGLTHILLVNDKTFTKEVTEANTTGPNYYYGMSPYYGRYGAYGPSMGMSYGTSTTTYSTDTKTFPYFETYFECTDVAYDARVSLKNLSASQVETFVKDVQGAVLVNDVLDESPNKGKLQKADIITKVNGERVTKILDVYQASRQIPGQKLKVEFFRDGKKRETEVSFLVVTDLVAKAQEEIINSGCKDKGIKDISPLCKKL